MKITRISETGWFPSISQDGRWALFGFSSMGIIDLQTLKVQDIQPPGFVGGFLNSTTFRYNDPDRNKLYEGKLEGTKWVVQEVPNGAALGSHFAVRDGHWALNLRSGQFPMNVDGQVIETNCIGCDTAQGLVVFSKNVGDQRYELWVWDAERKQYVDKFKPRIGPNEFRINHGYVSYGYFSRCWVRTPDKRDIDITVNQWGGESPAHIIKSGNEIWALSTSEYAEQGNNSAFLILRPLGDNKIIRLPFGAVRPWGTFIDGRFLIIGNDARGVMHVAEVPLNEPREALKPPSPAPVPVPVPPPRPVTPMPEWKEEYRALLLRFAEKFGIPRGTGEEAAREWTHKLAEQFCFTFGTSFGHKSAGPGRPHSADAVAVREGSKLFCWDVLSDAGGPDCKLIERPRTLDITGQLFEVVTAVNHLGAPAPPPPPPPSTECKFTPCTCQAQPCLAPQALESLTTQLTAISLKLDELLADNHKERTLKGLRFVGEGRLSGVID